MKKTQERKVVLGVGAAGDVTQPHLTHHDLAEPAAQQEAATEPTLEANDE